MTKDAPGPGHDRATGFPCLVSVDGDRSCITADLRGIGEEKVRLDLDGCLLVISTAADWGRELRTSIALPWPARIAEKRFRKGSLELILTRSGS